MGALDTAKELAKLVQKLDNIEVVQKVIELQGDLMELQERFQELLDENRDLKKKLEAPTELLFQDNMYWRAKGKEEQEGPFCTKCFDGDGKTVRMHGGESRGLTCPHCKTFVDTKTAAENRRKASQARQANRKDRSRSILL